MSRRASADRNRRFSDTSISDSTKTTLSMLLDADLRDVALDTHHIFPQDCFAAFYQARKQNLLMLIEKAMGKQVIAVALPEEAEAEIEAVDGNS